MTLFIVATLVMTAIALMWVLPVLLRRRPALTADAAQTNLAVLRDQFAELERDAASGLLSTQQLNAAREDLERRALEDARVPAQTLLNGASKQTAIVLAIVAPLLAGGLYWALGNPAAITLAPSAGHESKLSSDQIEMMLKKLETRLEQSPDDAKGWAMLGRSYLVLQRYAESTAAYARATALIKDDADLLADYADALAMVQGRRIDGKALQVVEQALRIDPAQWKALAMAGASAFERKDYRKAIAYWESLQKRTELDPEFMRNIASSLDEARQLAGGKAAPAQIVAAPRQAEAAPAVTGAAVRGTIKLADSFAAKAAPTDTVFIFARAVQGPRAPLAVLRRQVKDLPYEFTLDDSMAMTPELKLSRFPQFIVGARISKSANAIAQSGDMLGTSKPLQAGASGVVVVIDGVVP